MVSSAAAGLSVPLATDKPRILFLITEDWYFWSHRLDLARAVRDAGMEVLVATRVGDYGKRIEDEGFRLIPIRMSRGSWNPLREAATVLDVTRLYRRERPDLVHHVAMKPMLYGSIAARLAGVPAVVNAFAGLGYAFIAEHQSARLLRGLIGWALRWALALPRSRVIVQNDTDREQLVQAGIVHPSQVVVIRGAGVDTTTFSPTPEPAGTPVIMLASRMLWDKGVGEFVEAIRLLKARGLDFKGVLVGMLDEDNPACIPHERLRSWQADGVIEWRGHKDDMPRVLASAHIVVLPSYREGFPKVLLEAAACARPIVATDVPGCREIVQHGVNGLLVPPRDAKALAEAIATLVQDRAMRLRMGTCGREIVKREFSAEQVARETLEVYRELLDRAGYPRPVVSVSS
jgi:glycosyltransferase involved in cell wall biosynthesis